MPFGTIMVICLAHVFRAFSFYFAIIHATHIRACSHPVALCDISFMLLRRKAAFLFEQINKTCTLFLPVAGATSVDIITKGFCLVF